jgi:methylenetetrahydrofolate--tRNA-(uracil-5-)-methyltransferase
MAKFRIIGGGLAGSEAAWQCLRQGHSVELFEMRPIKTTAAHQSQDLAELVCSNSLKSEDPHSAPGLLKKEMLALDSLIIQSAYAAKVPAGNALAVERKLLSQNVLDRLQSFPNFQLHRGEVDALPSEQELEERDEFWIIATGPLTSDGLAQSLVAHLGGTKQLYFYDAIAPVIDADSIDMDIAFIADRYGEMGKGDYLNLPMHKEEYLRFIEAAQAAEKMPLHDFEEPKYFESCLPIEVMIERGIDTLRFGPLKPVGFTDPRTGKRPYALVQLRAENKDKTMYSMVGFQTKMKWPEQRRVFNETIPGLQKAEFYRYGSVHRNTYIESPKLLSKNLALPTNKRVFLAGQITGVEGYTESAAIGLIAARSAMKVAEGQDFIAPPIETVIGSLWNYVTHGGTGDYQPMNANFGLLPALVFEGKKLPKDEKRKRMAERASKAMHLYLDLQPSIPHAFASKHATALEFSAP